MIFDATGKVLAQARKSYSTLRPAPYYEEQDPALVRRKVYEAIAGCLDQPGAKPATVRALGFSSQMYGVFPLDGMDHPLANSMLWSDGRAELQGEWLEDQPGAAELYRTTGCPASGIFPIAKITWLREQRPDLFLSARRFASIKEYVTLPLVGEWVVDYSMASSTGMFDIRSHGWHGQALAWAGIGGDRLSRPASGLEPFALLEDSPLAGLGLEPGIPVFLGAGDGPLANLGSGASAVGAVNIDLGTSGAARCVTDAATTDDTASLWCFCLTDDLWTCGGIVTNVGNAYEWLGSSLLAPTLPAGEAYALMNRLAETAAPGADGLHFLPFLRKVRSPYWDRRLKGTIYGLTADHGPKHIARALLEAIAFDLRAILCIMGRRVRTLPCIVLTGGLAKSAIVPRILADVLGREIAVPEESEGSIAGAALMALQGIGAVQSFAFSPGWLRANRIPPDAAAQSVYDEYYLRHARLVKALREFDPGEGPLNPSRRVGVGPGSGAQP